MENNDQNITLGAPIKEILTISLDRELVSTLKTIAKKEDLPLETFIEKELSLGIVGYWHREQ